MKPGPNQTKFIAALRSGAYAQGRGNLHNTNGFCCLGVASELFKTETTRVCFEEEFVTYDGNIFAAPSYVIKALGLLNCLGEGSNGQSNMAGLNDYGKTFAEIADHYEANLASYATESL